MKIARYLPLLSVLLLQGCSDVLAATRMIFPLLMLVVIVGALFYAIYGNRGARREENDRRTPDSEDSKKQ